jgi:hypothetical protein
MKRFTAVLVLLICAALFTASTALAHDAAISADCSSVSVSFTEFADAANTASVSITVNGSTSNHTASWTGPSGSFSTGITTQAGANTIVVSVSWDTNGHQGSKSGTFYVNCEGPPPTDVCPNIEGAQETIPPGMIKDQEGNCVTPPPTDVCPNLEGAQETVPAGTVKDDQGNCVTPAVVVVCPDNTAGKDGRDEGTPGQNDSCFKPPVAPPAASTATPVPASVPSPVPAAAAPTPTPTPEATPETPAKEEEATPVSAPKPKPKLAKKPTPTVTARGKAKTELPFTGLPLPLVLGLGLGLAIVGAGMVTGASRLR